MIDHTVPTQAYHAAFGDFYDGDYRSALDHFKTNSLGASRPRSRAGSTRSVMRRCRVNATTKWASSPRPWPITRMPWKSTRHFPPGSPRSFSRRSAPTPAERKCPPGRFAGCKPRWANCRSPCHCSRARPSSRQQLSQGGPVQQATMFPVEPAEILRCTTLAIRRRGELLGPLAAHDPLIDNIIAALQRRPGQPNHWSEAGSTWNWDWPYRPVGGRPQRFRSCSQPRSRPVSSSIR